MLIGEKTSVAFFINKKLPPQMVQISRNNTYGIGAL
jgi:hypothetical protein